MTAVPTFLAITEEQIISYFRKQGAMSKDRAIILDIADLQSTLDAPEFVLKDFSEFSFVKKTNDGKYFIDETAIRKQNKLVVRISIIIAGLVIFVPLILGLLLNLLGFIFNWW